MAQVYTNDRFDHAISLSNGTIEIWYRPVEINGRRGWYAMAFSGQHQFLGQSKVLQSAGYALQHGVLILDAAR